MLHERCLSITFLFSDLKEWAWTLRDAKIRACFEQDRCVKSSKLATNVAGLELQLLNRCFHEKLHSLLGRWRTIM